ncbi:hypothetical protein B0A55_09659 [Friedmanniomyces simplex]|uniref:Uncharacterized protein n=1 Tax=Friedmanniomyces simplex TaxID=329884 RepID=A0A4U0WW67_9PEZI|nr:hypothetical protein B0A55_09659 [Friedmanniomyces simplex]
MLATLARRNLCSTPLPRRLIVHAVLRPGASPRPPPRDRTEAVRTAHFDPSTSARNLPKEPESISFQTFQERAASRTATLSDARGCVLHHDAPLHNLSPERRREEVKAQAVGGRVLMWLWETGCGGDGIFRNDHHFTNTLCSLLVEEDLEDFTWKWIEVACQEVKTRIDSTGAAYDPRELAWTGRLLGALAAAHLALAPGRLADNALERYCRALGMIEQAKAACDPYPPLVAMYVVLDRALKRPTCLPCSTRGFEAFLASQGLVNTADRVALSVAGLHLYHPTRPTAKPMLRLLQSKDPMLDTVLSGSRPSGRNQMGGELLRAAYILRCEGAEDEAAFVEAVVEASTPAVWLTRETVYRVTGTDPKLVHLTKGTPRLNPPSQLAVFRPLKIDRDTPIPAPSAAEGPSSPIPPESIQTPSGRHDVGSPHEDGGRLPHSGQ